MAFMMLLHFITTLLTTIPQFITNILSLLPPSTTQSIIQFTTQYGYSITFSVCIMMMVSRYGKPSDAPHKTLWMHVLVSGIICLALLAVSYYLVGVIVETQVEYHQVHGGVPGAPSEMFKPMLPLDLSLPYDVRNVTQVMVMAGETGRSVYAWYTVVDTVNLFFVLWFHRSLLRFLNTNKADTDDESSLIKLWYQVPAVYAALDLYENVCGMYFLAEFLRLLNASKTGSGDVKYVLSNRFVGSVSMSTNMKFGVMYVLILMEVCSTMMYVYRTVTKNGSDESDTKKKPDVDVEIKTKPKEPSAVKQRRPIAETTD